MGMLARPLTRFSVARAGWWSIVYQIYLITFWLTVSLSACQTVRLSDCQTVRLQCETVKLLNYQPLFSRLCNVLVRPALPLTLEPAGFSHSQICQIYLRHTAHYTLNAVHYTLYTEHCPLHTKHWILHTENWTLHTGHWTLHTINCTHSARHKWLSPSNECYTRAHSSKHQRNSGALDGFTFTCCNVYSSSLTRKLPGGGHKRSFLVSCSVSVVVIQ